MKILKKGNLVDKKALDKAVDISSMLEGLSFERAKKNKEAIKNLKRHGRAFAI